jgi:exo-beta-1,3-glucanase (GH17 family)
MISRAQQVVAAEKAICYSGFRADQNPGEGTYPSYEEVREDLLILQKQWRYLRLYDVDLHAETVIDVIEREQLDMKIMLGAYIEAEMNNMGCPWGGGSYTEEQLVENAARNQAKIDKLIAMANAHPTVVHSLSAGNEATVDWTDHYVPVAKVVAYVRQIKAACRQPVTFCENYVPWLTKLAPLAEEVDFISIHTYPVWEYKHIHEALAYTIDNYRVVAERYPDKQVVITEAGWTTNSNGRGIEETNVCEDRQSQYYEELVAWSEKEKILTFVFEAFDELWKGSDDAMEPEKHWGLFTVDRRPKRAMLPYYPELAHEALSNP